MHVPAPPKTAAAFARAVLVTLVGGASGCADELEFGVSAPAPVADAGFDQVRVLPPHGALEIDLDGRASCDPLDEGAAPQGMWQLVMAPSADADAPVIGRHPLDTGDGLRARLRVEDAGTWVAALVVHIDERLSAEDLVTIEVVADVSVDEVVLAPPATNACGGLVE